LCNLVLNAKSFYWWRGSSQSLISDSGDSEFYYQRQRKEAVSAEIEASLNLSFAGR
jgi:hypothetical protein